MEVFGAATAKSNSNDDDGGGSMDVDGSIITSTDAREGTTVNGTVDGDSQNEDRAWWLSSDSASVAANFRVSIGVKDIPNDVIDLGDSSDDDLIEELNSHKTASTIEMTKLRPGLTADDEVRIWSDIFSVPPQSVIRPTNKKVQVPLPSSSSSPTKRPKLKHAFKSTAQTPLRPSPSRNSSYTPMQNDMNISNEVFTSSNGSPIKYPRLNPLISLQESQVRQMLQRIRSAPQAPCGPDPQLTHMFQKIIRYGKFFDSSTLNDELGKYLSSFSNLSDAFKQSLHIFWDDETLQSHTIPSKIDSFDLKPDQILPIIPLQHEFWTYWNTITDDRHMPNASNQHHSLVTIVGLINSKHNKSNSSPRQNSRFQRQTSDENLYYDYYSEESSSQTPNVSRIGSSIARSPRNAMGSMQSTRDSLSDMKNSRQMIQPRPSPHRSLNSSRGRPSMGQPSSVDRRSSYTTSTPQPSASIYPSDKYEVPFRQSNGEDSCSSSNSNNHKVNTNIQTIKTGNANTTRQETSGKVGRGIGSKFDSIFQPKIGEMLAACTSLCKPMAAQPKAENWLPADAISRMNNLHFFNDLGLNLHIGVLIISQPTIAAAVRSVAIVFWGQDHLCTYRIPRPSSRTNMAPANPNGSDLEEAFHSLWDCILQFSKDENIWDRYLRAVIYISESVKNNQVQQNRNFSPSHYLN